MKKSHLLKNEVFFMENIQSKTENLKKRECLMNKKLNIIEKMKMSLNSCNYFNMVNLKIRSMVKLGSVYKTVCLQHKLLLICKEFLNLFWIRKCLFTTLSFWSLFFPEKRPEKRRPRQNNPNWLNFSFNILSPNFYFSWGETWKETWKEKTSGKWLSLPLFRCVSASL